MARNMYTIHSVTFIFYFLLANIKNGENKSFAKKKLGIWPVNTAFVRVKNTHTKTNTGFAFAYQYVITWKLSKRRRDNPTSHEALSDNKLESRTAVQPPFGYYFYARSGNARFFSWPLSASLSHTIKDRNPCWFGSLYVTRWMWNCCKIRHS